MDKDAFDARVAELDAGLFARLEGKDTYTGEEVYDSLVWLANELGIEDEEEADFGEGFTAVQGIWERLLTVTKSRPTYASPRARREADAEDTQQARGPYAPERGTLGQDTALRSSPV